MKTIKKGDQIQRIDDKTAEFMVNQGWEYCSKEEYKSKKPKVVKTKENVDEIEISPNLSEKKKRKLRKENKKMKYESK